MSSISPLRLRRWRAPIVLSAAMLTLGACGTGDGDAPDSPDAKGEVVIDRFTFMPEDIEVPAGTAVTWTNEDSAAHSIDDDGELFPASEELAEGETFSFTFDAPGEYTYICGIHPYMTGTVTVT